jgi:phosphoglycolate phosphatase-like HAD superfamily hydrolase
MAYEEATRAVTGIAGTAITQNRFVVLAADGYYDHVGTAQIMPDGVSQEDQATVGDTFPVGLPGGIYKIEAGEALSVGDVLASSAAGKAIGIGAANGNMKVGKALEAAAADGDIISFLFLPLGQINA